MVQPWLGGQPLLETLQIRYWNELRFAFRRRYVPLYYDRELMQKLQRLQQRDMSVEEYRQRMELLMLRANIRDEPRLTIVRFQSGINIGISDKVGLLNYNYLNDLVQLCVRVEEQLKRKTSYKKDYSY